MAELPYTAAREGNTALRSSWPSVSGTSGVWRRRADPTLSTTKWDDTHARLTTVPGLRGVQRLSGLRCEGFSALPYPMAMGGTLFQYGPGSGIDASIGNPAPSLRLAGRNRYVRRLKVAAGSRTVRVHALQPIAARARPKITIEANPLVGLASDVVEESGAGTGWLTIEATFTATSAGAVNVVLENPEPRHLDCCWFDNLFIL